MCRLLCVLLSTMLVKVYFACFVYWGKKLFVRYIGTTISVNVLNKSRGSEMHWVGGVGLKSLKGQYPPYNVRTSSCKCRRFMFFVFEKVIVVFFLFVSLKSVLYVSIYLCSIVVIFQ